MYVIYRWRFQELRIILTSNLPYLILDTPKFFELNWTDNLNFKLLVNVVYTNS